MTTKSKRTFVRTKSGPNPVDTQVGARIRTLRMERGRSQGWLAEQLGLTFQQVQKYEKGMNRIAPSRLDKVAEVLNAPIEYFFDKREGTSFESPGRDMLATPEGNYIARRWTDLSAGHRRLLKLIVSVLARDGKPDAEKAARELRG